MIEQIEQKLSEENVNAFLKQRSFEEMYRSVQRREFFVQA